MTFLREQGPCGPAALDLAKVEPSQKVQAASVALKKTRINFLGGTVTFPVCTPGFNPRTNSTISRQSTTNTTTSVILLEMVR